jgi:ABC-type nitrate/sulfonate/bicarbonate transport system permease component
LSLAWGWSLRVASLAALAIGWQLLAQRAHSLLVPSFTGTLAALAHLLTTARLWQALWISNLAMVLGFMLAATVGIAAGFVLGRWRFADDFVDPYLNMLLVTPMSAVIPIIIMALGLGLLSRVMVVFTFSFVTIAVNTRAGLRMIEPDWIEMTRAFGGTERQLWLKVLSRGARPAILMGLQLGLIRSVSGMITMELLLLAVGVGQLILDYQSNFEAGHMFATVLVVIAEAVLLARLCERLGTRATPWAEGAAVE